MAGKADLVNHGWGRVQCYLSLNAVVGNQRVFALRDRVVVGNQIPGAPKNSQFPIMAATTAPHKDSVSTLRAFLWCPCGLKAIIS